MKLSYGGRDLKDTCLVGLMVSASALGWKQTGQNNEKEECRQGGQFIRLTWALFKRYVRTGNNL